MRSLVIVAVAVLGCSDDDGPRSTLSCDPPAYSYGENCACFDGDVRCDPYPLCPIDLTLACTPGETCGDLSGGSAGQDCQCTCSDTGAWSCMAYGNSCIPI
jgi:hypothetical protein